MTTPPKYEDVVAKLEAAHAKAQLVLNFKPV